MHIRTSASRYATVQAGDSYAITTRHRLRRVLQLRAFSLCSVTRLGVKEERIPMHIPISAWLPLASLQNVGEATIWAVPKQYLEPLLRHVYGRHDVNLLPALQEVP